MEKTQRCLKIYVIPQEEQRIKSIQEFLLKGFSPSDLTDERLFHPPYSINDVWFAISRLNKTLGGFF